MPTQDWTEKLPRLLNSIKENPDITPKNKELIQQFSEDLTINEYSPARTHKLTTHIKRIAESIDIDLEAADKEDIKRAIIWVKKQGFAASTEKDYRVALRVFYKWLRYDDLNGQKYPPEVKWVKSTISRQKTKLPEDMLTEQDIRQLIEHATNPRCRCLISILWETGARMGEIMDLQVKNLNKHKHGYQVTVQGKTGARRIPLITSPPYINTWLNKHPLREDPEWPNIPLFTDIQQQDHRKKDKSKQAAYAALVRDIERTAERAGIDKPVNPHHFRHSRATYLANKFTEAQMCEWFGWAPGSDMPGRYTHLAGRDIDNAYQQLHGIQDKEETKPELLPQTCPRCARGERWGDKIEATESFCPSCGAPLSPDVALEIDAAEEEATTALSEREIMLAMKLMKKAKREGVDPRDLDL